MTSFFPQAEKSWRTLAQGKPTDLRSWLAQSRLGICILTIILGVGVYGASIGIWNGAAMACYVGIKLPFVIFFTLILNGLINGMVAQILGTGLSFRQTFSALTISFAIFALIVGSLSPITFGIALDMPGVESDQAGQTHRALLLFHTGLIGFAGFVSNHKLLNLLREVCHDSRSALLTLISWIIGNLFVGAQVGFLLRPIFGQPGLKIEFLRPDMFRGNFYESVWWAIRVFLNS